MEQAPAKEHTGAAELTRRGFIGLVGATAVAAAFLPEKAKLGANLLATRLVAPESPLDPESIDDERLNQHVVPLYNTLVSKFGTHDEGLYLEDNRDRSIRYAMVWPQSRVLDAMADARRLPEPISENAKRRYEAVRGAMGHYWKDEPFDMGSGLLPGLRELTPAGQPKYVDDNAWVAVRQAQHFIETGDPEALISAKRGLAMTTDEWDWGRGGGMRWNQDPRSGRCVVSNAPVVTLSMLLQRATGQSFMYWGPDTGCPETMEWLDKTLFDREHGIYSDNQYIDGGVEKTKWTYNQSSIAKAMAYLSQADPQRFPMQKALDLAWASFRYFDEQDRILMAKITRNDFPQSHVHDPDANDGYRSVVYSSIFFADMLEIADMVPWDTNFRNKVIQSLHERIRRLSHEYQTTLQQSGALRLAILAYQNPLPDKLSHND